MPQTNRFVGIFDSNSGLPYELILKILGKLDIYSLYNAFLTCKRFSVLSDDVQLWKYLCIRDFFNVNTKDENETYKTFYYKCSFKLPPGRGSSFILEDPEKNWKPICSIGRGEFKRIYRFDTNNLGSFFQQFLLYGAEDGHMSLTFRTKSNLKKDSLMEYMSSTFTTAELAHIKIRICYAYVLSHFIDTSHPKVIKKLFRIFISFNSLPKEDSDLIKKLVRAENWKKVTPLTKEEEKEIQES